MSTTASVAEPIAIVGMACRFPGADSPAEFWRLIVEGVDRITELPAERFDIEALYDPQPGARGKIVTRQGGVLPDVDRFDASFFGISATEAVCMDPQHRLLLEVASEAFEDAGVPQQRLAGSATGVFVGVWTSDYESRLFDAASDLDVYATNGTGRYAASGRLSYAFDLRGPSLTLDTGCSSSLVAVHLACQSLRSGETEMALAGGVNLILQPHITIAYSRSAILSADGRCRFGDAAAGGYVRSEGIGLVLLKPLSRAVADGDPVHALIRGSAVNNDGQGSGLLVAPSSAAQAAMLRRAYRLAGIQPACVGYVEAHGTGTRVGDPVELAALGEVLGDGRQTDRPRCRVGSVKTNIGHTEAAAGIAGLIKAVFCLKGRLIPPSLHFSSPNPGIPWDRLPLSIARTVEPWPTELRPAVAGVNSFGITGTNAHVVLEEAPISSAAPAASTAISRSRLLPLSAKSQDALQALTQRWVPLLDREEVTADLDDLCYTASVRRTHHAHRLAVVGATGAELAERLRAHARGVPTAGLVAARTAATPPRVAFVFPGQGSQWLGMGRALLSAEAVFADALRRCERALVPHVTWSLTDELMADAARSRLDQIDIVQPMLFAIQVALAALWRAWGVEPHAVVGHSMGEVAAAHVAGALSLDDAVRIIATRSQLLRRIAGRGAMAMVELSLDAARQTLAGREDRLSVAVSNSDRSTVISGDVAALDALIAELEGRDVFCRRVKVDVASHSPQVDELQADLQSGLTGIAPGRAALKLCSTVTGAVEDGPTLGPDYWIRNLRQPVLFSDAVGRLVDEGVDTFVELSPHPVLLAAVQDIVRHACDTGLVLPSGRREEDERAVMLESLGALWAHGYPVDWTRRFPGRRRVMPLPAYPWQRERFWFDEDLRPTASRSHRAPTLPTSRATSANDPQPLEELFHRVEWQSSPRPVPGHSRGRWLIVAGAADKATALVTRLEAAGQTCVVRSAGQVLDGAVGETLASEPPITGCVHLASLDVDPGVSPTDAPADGGWVSALTLVKALTEAPVKVTPRLWLVTRGAQRIRPTDEPASITAAAVWGLGAVVGYEHPALHTTRVDLEPGPDAGNTHALVQELLGGDTEDTVAWRGDTRYAARLARVPGDASSSVVGVRISPDGAYLVTGGTGGIGLVVARWLVERGARHLTLMGRRPPSTDVLRAVQALQALGAEVAVAQGDVAHRDDVQRVVAQASRGRPLRGVIHAAGSLDDGLLSVMDRERFVPVMATKVGGALHLDDATREAPLDFFICFSSVIGVLGSPGQANYAAANAALDAVAARRRAQGRPALSIAWGPWSQVGLAAARADRGDRLAERGLISITPGEGIAVLDRLLGASGTPLVMRFDSARWARLQAPAARSLLRGLLETTPATTSNGLPAQLHAAEPAARRDLLEAHLREEIGHVLRMPPARVGRETPLKDLGLNSLMSLELRNRLEASLNLTLPATLVWNHPTVAAVAAHLGERLGFTAPGPSSPGAHAADVELDELLTELRELPDDTIRRLMAERKSGAHDD